MGRRGFRSGSLGCLGKTRLPVNSLQVIHVVAGWQIGMMQGALSGCGGGLMIEGWRVREDKINVCVCLFFL